MNVHLDEEEEQDLADTFAEDHRRATRKLIKCTGGALDPDDDTFPEKVAQLPDPTVSRLAGQRARAARGLRNLGSQPPAKTPRRW